MQKPTDTEDKAACCAWGSHKEEEFCRVVAPRYGLHAVINPEKEHSPYAVDLLVRGKLCDLKTVETPFFTAQRYGYDPAWTVTINSKDILSYSGRDIRVIFWVDWEGESRYGVSVPARNGLWAAHITTLSRVLGPVHSYERRVGDKKNATESHLIDLRSLHHLKEGTVWVAA